MNTLKFGPMLITNFGPYIGSHVFNWDHGPSLWFIGGKNLVEPALGANDVGKSTLFNALFWCLTGQTLRNSRPGDRVEPWHSEGTTSVRLGFIAHDKKHELYRSRKPNKLIMDDRVVTDDEIRRLIPNPDVMLYSFLIGQTNTRFLDLTPEPQSQLFTDLLELDTYLEAAERAGNTVKEAEREIAKADLEIAVLTGRIAELDKGLVETKTLETEYELETDRKLVEFDNAIAALKQEHDQISGLLEKIPLNPLAPPRLEAELADAASNLTAWREIRINSEATLSVEQASLRKLDSYTTEVSKGLCPTCGQSLDKKDHKRLHEQFMGQSDEIAKNIAALIAKRDDATEEEREWSATHKAINDQLTRLREQENKRQTERRELERQVTRMDLELSAKQDARKQLYESTNPYTEGLTLLSDRLTKTEEDLDHIKTEKADAEKLRDTAKLWQDGFRAIRLAIIDDTLTEVALATNRHSERLGLSGWHIEFATERETKKGTTSLGFTTMLYPSDMDEPKPWDTYGGGVSTRWQLAISFGLSEVLLARAGISPNIEILDEVTKGLSQEGISDLLDCLAERARETGRTIWTIDHHALDKGSFDGIIMIEKTEDGSRIIQ
jgi:DNA repair exonuclease SbcCD ATPase subunit